AALQAKQSFHPGLPGAARCGLPRLQPARSGRSWQWLPTALQWHGKGAIPTIQSPLFLLCPRLAVAVSGSRVAWETLYSDDSVNSFSRLGAGIMKQQSVTRPDAATAD